MANNATITLVSLDELKTAAKIPTSNNAFDLSMELALESVSEGMEDFLHRRIHSGIASSTLYVGALEVRYYTATCASELQTDDILQLVSLRTDNNGDSSFESTHSTAQFYLTPFNATLDLQPYTAVTLRTSATAYFPVNVARTVEVTGVFGYCPTTAILPVFKKACLLQAMMDFRSEDAPFGAAGGRDFTVEQSRSFAGAALHPFVRRMLDTYRRRVVA